MITTTHFPAHPTNADNTKRIYYINAQKFVNPASVFDANTTDVDIICLGCEKQAFATFVQMLSFSIINPP